MTHERFAPEYKNSGLEIVKARLANLGLNLQNLMHLDCVVDIGAKDCLIEKETLRLGYHGVISVDKHFPSTLDRAGLRVIETDASKLPLLDGSVDLVLVPSSAYFYTKNPDETLNILKELNRVLRPNGFQRIYPARFGHIMRELMDKNFGYNAAKSKNPERRTKKDTETITFYENLAEIESVNFLKDHGIMVKKREVLRVNPQGNFKHYLLIPKLDVNRHPRAY